MLQFYSIVIMILIHNNDKDVIHMKKTHIRFFFLLIIFNMTFLISFKTTHAASKKDTQLPKPVVTSLYQDSVVSLSWKKVKGAEEYVIFKQNKDRKYKRIGITTDCTYMDKNVKNNKRYKYKVCAVDITNNIRTKGKKTVFSIYTAKIDPNKPMIALTFDDGPGKYTKKIAKCLKNNDSRATYFVVGNRINTYKSELKYAYQNGNEIGNHSYSHPNFYALSSSGIKSQIKKTDKLIQNITGESVKLLRTPGGARSKTISTVAEKPMFYWSIDTRDWENRNTNKIVNSVMNKVKDGDIILIHEIYSFSSDAILKLIPKLRKKGYQLVTVSELAQYKGYKLKNGKVYYSFP